MDVGYYRRWFGNFQVTDDLALAASDFTQFALKVPSKAGVSSGRHHGDDVRQEQSRAATAVHDAGQQLREGARALERRRRRSERSG
jgi:hypothetical protein